VSALDTAAIVDGAARVIADAINGHVFAAGVTQTVTDPAPAVVPLADDFTEGGLPAVTVALGAWEPLLQPGNERLHVTLVCAVWRPRVPLGDNTVALYGDRDAIADAWLAHSKAYLAEARIQSAVLMGGPGIVPRSIPITDTARLFLTLPFTVEVITNRAVVPAPA
jgi:hypothetical protein